jgi:hypothetical protein
MGPCMNVWSEILRHNPIDFAGGSVENKDAYGLPSESPVQLELIYRKVLWTYPAAAHTARKPLRARVDDGLDYMLKDDSGAPVRAREWICHHLADRAGVPVMEYKPILTPAGRVVFGSRFILNGGPGGMANIISGTLALAEGGSVLSKIYALDLLLGNSDRHPDNFMVENDPAGTPRVRAIDFSEACALIDPIQRVNIPAMGTSTVAVGRMLRNHYPFSLDAACLALDRVAAVASLKQFLEEMPADWLATDTRNEIATWWLSAARAAHITNIRNGLSNGTLL